MHPRVNPRTQSVLGKETVSWRPLLQRQNWVQAQIFANTRPGEVSLSHRGQSFLMSCLCYFQYIQIPKVIFYYIMCVSSFYMNIIIQTFFKKTALADRFKVQWSLVVRSQTRGELKPEVDCSCRVSVTSEDIGNISKGNKKEVSETLPQAFILSSLLCLHDQFHPHVSLLSSALVTNSAEAEFHVQPQPGEKPLNIRCFLLIHWHILVLFLLL